MMFHVTHTKVRNRFLPLYLQRSTNYCAYLIQLFSFVWSVPCDRQGYPAEQYGNPSSAKISSRNQARVIGVHMDDLSTLWSIFKQTCWPFLT